MLNKLTDQMQNPLFVNIGWAFMAKVFAMVFYFAADIFYARFLGVDKYAEWVFFFSIASLAFYIGEFGINISAKVHIAKSDLKEKYLGAALGARLKFSMAIFAVIFITAPFIADTIRCSYSYPNLKKLMYILGGMVFFNSVTEFFKQLYIGVQELKRLCVVTAIEYSLYCVFSILLLLMDRTTISIAWGYFFAGVITSSCNIFIIYRKYNKNLLRQSINDMELQRKIVRYAMPLVLTSLGGVVLTEMDTFMLGLLCTQDQISSYSIAKQLVSRATNVNMVIWTGTVASLAMITKENLNEKKNKFKKVSRLNNTISIAICLCFALFGRFAIKFLYGVEYMAANKILVILLPYYFLYCLSSLYANFLDFMGHAKTRALWFISVIVINFYLNYMLIPRYGATGASIATISAIIPYTLYCLYDVYVIFKKRKIDFKSVF